MDAYLAMIYAFAGNFPIRGYAFCDGQIISIAQNTALFSLLGTNYGGNGINTFALPDLRGRSIVHQGQGPGLSSYYVGQSGGAEVNTLITGNLPAHSHGLAVSNTAGTTGTPASNTVFAKGPLSGSGPNATNAKSYTTAPADTVLASQSIANTGGGQPFSIRAPYLTVCYIIALEGIFPSRN